MITIRRILGSPVYRRRWIKLIAGLAIAAGIVYMSGRIWWTGSGYCIGSMVECMGPLL